MGSVEIELGATSSEWAQIVDGSIAEQDQILLAFGEREKRLLPDAPKNEARPMPTMKAPPATESLVDKSKERTAEGTYGGRPKSSYGGQGQGKRAPGRGRSGSSRLPGTP